jgi:hypothetical protein
MAALRREDHLARTGLTKAIDTLRSRGLAQPSLATSELTNLLNALFDGLIVRLAMQPELDRARLRQALLETLELLLGLKTEHPA